MTDYSQYFASITHQDQLYSQLTQLVEVELAKEREGRTAIQAAFDSDTADILSKFHEETAGPKTVADHKLAKAKIEFETQAKAITEKALKRIQKLEGVLKAKQDAVINKFNKATKIQSTNYEDAVKPFKEQAEAQIAKLVEDVEFAIEPINKAYEARAKELDIQLD
jgi:hypothetical protein